MLHLLRMFRKIVFILFLPIILQARIGEIPPPTPTRPETWLSGPLITPSAHAVEPGHFNIEQYFYWYDLKGVYNKHWRPVSTPHFKELLIQPTANIGILPGTELDIVLQGLYNNSQGQHAWRVGDLPFTFGIQLLNEVHEEWIPAIKLRLAATIPIGKYDRLNPKKFATDYGGAGNWLPGIGLVFSKLFYLGGYYFLDWRMHTAYYVSTPVHVRGFNYYGGVPETRGTVYPGNIFFLMEALEVSVSRSWGFTLDIVYQHSNRNRFSGHSPRGTKPVFPSSENLSLAPGVEYNVNANLGFVFGPWFSIAGRNVNDTYDFLTWILAINYYQ